MNQQQARTAWLRQAGAEYRNGKQRELVNRWNRCLQDGAHHQARMILRDPLMWEVAQEAPPDIFALFQQFLDEGDPQDSGSE